jgi:hypothetical protein
MIGSFSKRQGDIRNTIEFDVPKEEEFLDEGLEFKKMVGNKYDYCNK